jgi:outer membrane protein OmpA-like peptidoglycan-associated protein
MTKGMVIPPEASGTKNTPQKDMSMVRDENRKVEFIFSNPFMEAPVVMTNLIESPIDHDVVFALDENEADVNSWNIYIEGNGKTLSYGPFYGSTVRVDPNVLLSDEEDGFYRARAVVNTEAGRTVSETKSFTLQREVMDDNEIMGERFALLFDFDEEDPDNIPFEEFLLTEVIPSIESDERVIIHGHTDVVGLADYNYELSLKRAQTVESIIERELKKKNVNAQVDAIGFGESDMRVTFDNSLPEGRYYNRNVIIEIIPNTNMSVR